MSDCRVPMLAYEAPGEFDEAGFRKVVASFAAWGDWSAHEWHPGSGKFYAKLFGPMGFVTIEDYTWRGWGYTVSARLRQPRGECQWVERRGLSADDGSLADAVDWACRMAGMNPGRNGDEKPVAASAGQIGEFADDGR